MKKFIVEIFSGKNSKLSALLVLGIFMFIGLGCFGIGRSKSSTPIPAAYLGDWQGQDGTTLAIRGDGTGDYHAGSTKVDGGTAEVNEAAKTLSITFFGIGKTLEIDQPPAGDQMKLDGITFRRKGGFTDSTSTSNSSTSNSTSTPMSPSSSPTNKSPFSSGDNSTNTASRGDEAPSDNEVETLVKQTMSDFASGVEQGSFNDLRSNSSKDFQATFPISELNNQFQVFLDKKDAVLPILRDVDDTSVDFSEPPHIRTEKGYKLLDADGKFPTSPNAIKFETEYELEKGHWKLLSLKVKM